MQPPPTGIDDIYLAALELPGDAERAAYLDQACGGNPQLRARIDRLLQAQPHVGNFLESVAPDLSATATRMADTQPPSTVIGPYKLLQKLGEGGMGVVYLAEQTHPIQRRVALKLIKPGLDNRQVIARFEAERQALALMDHPNIAKVLDAGTVGVPASAGSPCADADDRLKPGLQPTGQPYFVMELVNGLPLTKFCDERRLTPRERLELFIPVCQAVQHAHQKGIIHRDLKPSNVVVALYDGRPVPKVIDFGVAKATGSKLTDKTMFTEFGTLVGTFQYMSPEQAERNQLDIDTRSDIYSLGVLLYELLTGTTPLDKKRLHGAALLELMRIIKEEDPPKPSTRLSTTDELPSIAANRGLEPKRLSGLVRGDLDWIVMKALEKDRNRRYETVNGFAADIRRYLDHEAVEACPPSAVYRLKKFVGRNRAALATTGLVASALLVGTAVSIWQAIEATRARQLADERRQLAEANFQLAQDAVDRMLTRVVEDKLVHTPGGEPIRKLLLEDALQFYERFLNQRGDARELRFEVAKAWRRVGFIKYWLSDYAGNIAALKYAGDLLEALLREQPDDVTYLELLAVNCSKIGVTIRYVEGESAVEDVLQHGLMVCRKLQQLVPDKVEHRRTAAEIQYTLADTYNRSGKKTQAIDLIRDVVHTQREILAESQDKVHDGARLIWSLFYLAEWTAHSDWKQADDWLAEAEELGKNALQTRNDHVPFDDFDSPELALAHVLCQRVIFQLQYNWSAKYARQTPSPAEQEPRLRRAIDLLKANLVIHPDHTWTRSEYIDGHILLCELLLEDRRMNEVNALYRELCRDLAMHNSSHVQPEVNMALKQMESFLNASEGGNDEELDAVHDRLLHAVIGSKPKQTPDTDVQPPSTFPLPILQK